MNIKLTDNQVKSIWGQLTVNEIVDLLGNTPKASLDAVCGFIYYYAREGWMQDKLKETIASTPIQMELFPDSNTS